MILFKNSFVHIFSLFLIAILIILWEIGEIESKQITKRGIMDNINNGIKFAGQMLGINNAADVANLVAKSFSPKKIYDEESSLNTGETQNSNFQSKQNEFVTDSPPPLNTGLMIANMLKIMGLDTAKLGAVALNVIIVIAQMIGSAFTQNPSIKNSEIPNHISDFSSRHSSTESNEHEYRSRKTRKLKTGSPFDWILENGSEEFQQIFSKIRDEKLSKYIIEQINTMEHENGDGDCIKMLICKSEPFILGMQKQVINRIDGNVDESLNNKENKTDMFFKFLPSVHEFQKYSDICEEKFPKCKLNKDIF